LSCALGEKIVGATLPNWGLARDSINTNGITALVRSLPRYAQLARNLYPVLCVADTDGHCPVKLLSKWLPDGATKDLSVRLAVTEAESWLLADPAIADFLQVPQNRLPRQPDSVRDPKSAVIQLAKRSKNRMLRTEMVAQGRDGPGAGYSLHLRQFASTGWNPLRAASGSPSLHRSIATIKAWGEQVRRGR
jgi:hypothetical protein